MKADNIFYYGDETPEWQRGILFPKQRLQIKLEEADTTLRDAMSYILRLTGKEPFWDEQYVQISKWLENNDRKGLFISGDCGRGKSLIARYVLPAILSAKLKLKIPVFEYYELNPCVDKIVGGYDRDGDVVSGLTAFVLDDIGAESQFNQFGNVRFVFADIMDAVEKDARFIIATTNLDKTQLLEKYGARTIDRIIATCKWVEFNGRSLR